jgi:hypothetical protein
MQKHFIIKKDNSLLTPLFRVSFPWVFKPNEEGKYGLGMLFEKDTDFTNLDNLIDVTKGLKWPQNPPHNLMHPILDGDESSRPEYSGYFYINGKGGKYRPGVIDVNGQPIEDPEEFYPGCYARAVITGYTWSRKGKNGVSISVRNLQKCEEGEPLIGRVLASDDFDMVGASDESEDL